MNHIDIEVDITGWEQHSKDLKSKIRQNIRNYLRDVGEITENYARKSTPIGKPITPKGDRPRPGHTYGDLARGWKMLRIQKMIMQSGEGTEYEGGLTHDAIGKPTTGARILDVLEYGAIRHFITRRKKDLIFFDTRYGRVVNRWRVLHPGAKPRKIISRIQEFAYEKMSSWDSQLVEGLK